MKQIIKKLVQYGDLSDKEWKVLIEDPSYDDDLKKEAIYLRKQIYGSEVYILSLIHILTGEWRFYLWFLFRLVF